MWLIVELTTDDCFVSLAHVERKQKVNTLFFSLCFVHPLHSYDTVTYKRVLPLYFQAQSSLAYYIMEIVLNDCLLVMAVFTAL